tara:strand:- start:431 stop:1036 length:606 start_codon:yes stop_codon:yes gene_type:complete
MAYGTYSDEPKQDVDSKFTINHYENASANYQKYSGGNAVGTIQIIANPPDAETVLSITSAAGTTKTYVFMEDDVDSTGTIYLGSVVIQIGSVSGVGNIAAEVQAAINHANGHNGGTANSVINISRTDGVLTLTQVVEGPDGNKTISFTGSASQVATTSFVGGDSGELNQVPFSVGINGVIPSLFRDNSQAYVVEQGKTTNN